MSKVLQYDEALKIAQGLSDSYGFTCDVTFEFDETRSPESRVALCNDYNEEVPWWKFWVKYETPVPILYGATIEDVLLAFEAHLKGEGGQGRIDKADQLRKMHADLLLEEKLEEEDA